MRYMHSCTTEMILADFWGGVGTRSHSVGQDALDLSSLLPQSHKSWDYRLELCAQVYVGGIVCAHAHVTQVLLNQYLSCLEMLGTRPQAFFCCCPQALGFISAYPDLLFSCVFWGWNSTLHAYAAYTLLTEPSLQPKEWDFNDKIQDATQQPAGRGFGWWHLMLSPQMVSPDSWTINRMSCSQRNNSKFTSGLQSTLPAKPALPVSGFLNYCKRKQCT